MYDELWVGIEFKLGEAQFFLEWMSKVLMPAHPSTPGWHPTPSTLMGSAVVETVAHV
jgi:hypothetical protein